MEGKRYKVIAALDCLLCIFFISKSIPAYIEECKNSLGFASIYILNAIAIIVLLCFIKYPKLKNVSSHVQIIWEIMKLLVFGLFVIDLKLDMAVIVNLISLTVTIAFIVMQIVLYKQSKFYFEKRK